MSRDGGGRMPVLPGPRATPALRASAAGALLLVGLLVAAGAPTAVIAVLVPIPYAASAAICFRRARLRADCPQRAAWIAAGAAMTTGVAGALWAAVSPAERGEPAHTSAVDGLAVLGFVLLYVFVGLLLRSDRPVFNSGIWLDGVVAGLGIAALSCLGAPGRAEAGRIGVHLAGVLVYLVLILLVVIGGTLGGRRLDRTHVLVVAAFGAASIADGLSMLGHAGGTLAEPGSLMVLSLALPALLAFAPRRHRPSAGPTRRPRHPSWAGRPSPCPRLRGQQRAAAWRSASPPVAGVEQRARGRLRAGRVRPGQPDLPGAARLARRTPAGPHR